MTNPTGAGARFSNWL